jgi:hypothetical protein
LKKNPSAERGNFVKCYPTVDAVGQTFSTPALAPPRRAG